MAKSAIELTDANFIETVKASKVPVLVDFWAPWCGPCRLVEPAVEELGEAYAGRLQVAKLNTDEHPSIAGQFGIRSIPTLLLFKDGEVAEMVIGAVPKAKLEEKIKKVVD